MAAVGAGRARSLGYDLVMHCAEAAECRAAWRELHRRPTAAVPGVRFYSHSTCSSLALTEDAVADALTGQAMTAVDFPAMIERAYSDGVRIFVEHGPHAGCTRWIGDVLGSRPHLAVAMDRFGRSSLSQSTDTIAALLAAGVSMDLAAVAERFAPSPRVRVTTSGGRRMTVRSHPLEAARRWPDRGDGPNVESPLPEVMAPAPRLPTVDRASGSTARVLQRFFRGSTSAYRDWKRACAAPVWRTIDGFQSCSRWCRGIA